MKWMKANNSMNITHVKHITMQERKRLLQCIEYRNQWKQVSLKALEFFMESEINNNTEYVMNKKKEQCKQHNRKLTKALGRSNELYAVHDNK